MEHNNSHLLKAVKNIYWNLLRRQKEYLIEMQSIEVLSQQQFETIEGMLSLLDAIQDAAVDDGLAKREVVFGVWK